MVGDVDQKSQNNTGAPSNSTKDNDTPTPPRPPGPDFNQYESVLTPSERCCCAIVTALCCCDWYRCGCKCRLGRNSDSTGKAPRSAAIDSRSWSCSSWELVTKAPWQWLTYYVSCEKSMTQIWSCEFTTYLRLSWKFRCHSARFRVVFLAIQRRNEPVLNRC
jgi:hypothetical protein